MVRLAVVGLGWWGKRIVGCLKDSARVKIVAGCDLAAGTLASFADTHGIDLTDSYEALLQRTDVDAVAIVTPHALHEDQVLAAYAAGKQVFCEKPLALSVASAERMLEASAKAGGVLGIGHERRYEPAMEDLQRLAREGALGKLLLIDANVSYNLFRTTDPDHWRRTSEHAPAGAMTALGVHLTDLAIALAGKPVRVTARTASQVYPPPAEDFVSVDIEFTGGARARIICLSSPPYYGRFTVIGDRGWVEVQEEANVDKGLPSTFVQVDAENRRTTRKHEWTDTVRKNFEAWADAIEVRAPYRYSADQLFDNVRILDAVVRSAAADGKPIMV